MDSEVLKQQVTPMVREYIEQLEANQVKRGQWLSWNSYVECSECHEDWDELDNDYSRFNYCPNCGAKMEVK